MEFPPVFSVSSFHDCLYWSVKRMNILTEHLKFTLRNPTPRPSILIVVVGGRQGKLLGQLCTELPGNLYQIKYQGGILGLFFFLS